MSAETGSNNYSGESNRTRIRKSELSSRQITMAPIATTNNTNGQMENPVGVAENGGECDKLRGI